MVGAERGGGARTLVGGRLDGAVAGGVQSTPVGPGRGGGSRGGDGGVAVLSWLFSRPIVWGQATGSGPGSGSLSLLALRRWCSSLTLSSPDPVPGLSGLWSWLLGLSALLVLSVAMQGPSRALGQLFDLAGHARLLGLGLDRLRGAGRMLSLVIGATVLSWTVGQTLAFNAPEGRDDLLLLIKARSLGELALEQGVLAALTPMRDLIGLGDNLPLLMMATVVLLRTLAERTDRRRGVAPGPVGGWASGSIWSHVAWGATGLY